MSDPSVRQFTPRQERWLHAAMKPLSWANTFVYRLSDGKIGGRWLRGAPVMLLTTVGRKSGAPRTVPVLYLRDGENVVAVASQAGLTRHPVWYLNLEANPEVTVEIGSEKREMTARRATDEEKAALWPRLVEMYRDFDDYQARTERNIPVVILSPR
jgi:deazaflavin-dependent oxidoreductase (nitroreductase family)